jgi:demethylmenaquinone methyltransferase / 2-methoxy-6-polyprenyl-1,4-benzoquinol methylase
LIETFERRRYDPRFHAGGFEFDPVTAALDNLRDRAIQAMFDRIAGQYDVLNRVISFHCDRTWRNRAVQEILKSGHQFILDLGAGTGDLTFTAARKLAGNGRVVGLDVSHQMLKLARSKQISANQGEKTCFVQGSAMFSPFKDSIFDGVMSAFVLRNVSDLSLFFAHAFRVLKDGGKFVSLDMFPPSKSWFSAFYSLYFYRLVPWIGALLAQDRIAYKYLAESVESFGPPERVTELLEQAGFKDVRLRRFLNGAVCLHVADKINPASRSS